MKNNTIIYSCILLFFSHYTHTQDCIENISLKELMHINSSIKVQYCDDVRSFCWEPFPLSFDHSLQPYQGAFLENFIITIPHGRVQSAYGFVVVEDKYFISELNWKSLGHHNGGIRSVSNSEIVHIPGRVAVLGQLAFFNYWHWITEVLARLAMLEMNNISYDWLYIPMCSNYMIETLALWGIDSNKIINAADNQYFAIEADELIVPSLVSRMSFNFVPLSCYPSYHVFDYVVPKLLQAMQNSPIEIDLPKRLFISRKDAPSRYVINEDGVFALFEKKGFKRCRMSDYTVTEQIQLFHNAEIIAGPAGTGVTANSLFCKPNTHIIELFQALGDSTMWYVAWHCGLRYQGVKTIPFGLNYLESLQDTYMPLEIIQNVVDEL